MLKRTVGQDFPRALCCYDHEREQGPGSDDEELSVEVPGEIIDDFRSLSTFTKLLLLLEIQ